METKVFLIEKSEALKFKPDKLSTLFPNRLKNSERFKREEDRLRSIGAGILLHGLLKVSENDIVYGENGKPYLKENDLFFNLSHSGDYILLATDYDEIGADIEIIDNSHLSIASRVFLKDEIIFLNQNPLPHFFKLWTLKESVMKQCGKGLSLPPDSFSVMPIINGKSLEIFGKRLYGKTFLIDNHIASVCATHPIPSVQPKIVTASDFLWPNTFCTN